MPWLRFLKASWVKLQCPQVVYDPIVEQRVGHAVLLDVLIAVAEELQTDPGSVAIAWVIARGVVPILGARTRAQLETNMQASSFRLSSGQIQRLDSVSGEPAGYPHEMLVSEDVRSMITGNRSNQIDLPRRSVR